MTENEVSELVIGAAIEVHRELGPGLLESAYERCLFRELSLRGIPFECQINLPIRYKGELIDCGYRIDLIVADLAIVELKSIDKFQKIHDAQLITYLKISGKRLGLLINFNVPVLKDGIRRKVLGLPE